MSVADGCYVLYGGGVTRGLGPQMVMEEGGIPYRLSVVDELGGEHRSPAYRTLNPAGLIPTLIAPDGQILHEAPAIMLYLAERHRLDALLPGPDDPARGTFLVRFFFQTNDIVPAMSRFFRPERFSTEASHTDAIRQRAFDEACEKWSVLEGYLAAEGPYNLGDRFSLADLHMALWTAYGLRETDDVTSRFPAVRRCFELTAARPKILPLIETLIEDMGRWRAANAARLACSK